MLLFFYSLNVMNLMLPDILCPSRLSTSAKHKPLKTNVELRLRVIEPVICPFQRQKLVSGITCIQSANIHYVRHIYIDYRGLARRI